MKRFLVFFFILSVFFLAGVAAFRLFPEKFEKTIELLKLKKSPADRPTPPKIAPAPPADLGDAAAFLKRGESFLENGFLRVAINDFSRAVDLAPQNKTAWKKLISAEKRLRDFDAAERDAKKALEIFPNDGDFLADLGTIKIAQSDFSGAWEIFSAMPDSPKKDFYRGLISAFFEKHDAAKKFLNAAKNDPIFGPRAAVILTAYSEFSLFDDADPLYLKLLLTKSFVDLGFFEPAIATAKKIIKTRPDYRDAWLLLGYSYLSLEKYDLAENILKKARELDPTKPETAFFLGLAKKERGDIEGAISDLTAARENGFSDEKNLAIALGNAYLAGNYFEAARAEFERVAKMPGGVEKWVDPVRVSILFLRDPAAAKIFAQKAVAEFPDAPVAQNLLAWAEIENGELSAAENLLKKIVKKNPKFAPAIFNLGRIAEKNGDLPTAIEKYKTAYELDPTGEIGKKAAEKYNFLVGKKDF